MKNSSKKPYSIWVSVLVVVGLAACTAASATAEPTSTRVLPTPTATVAATAVPAPPAGFIPAGELYVDAAEDMAESFLDVLEFQATVDEGAETLEVVFRLRDLPQTITRRQVLNFVEYSWEVAIYLAPPTSGDAQVDAGIFMYTLANEAFTQPAEGAQTPVPGTPEAVPLGELWDEMLVYTAAGGLAAPGVVADPDTDTLSLTAQIPGISSSAVFSFSTFHFDGSIDRPDGYVEVEAGNEPVELMVNAYPGPHHYEGDRLTFEVQGLDGTSDSVTLTLDGGESTTLVGEWLTHDTLLLPLAFDTSGLTGSHELALSFQDGSVEYIYPLDLLPAAERQPNEHNAVWLTQELDCCTLHYLSGTAAARDIDFIAQHFDVAANEILALYGKTIDTKLDVYVIDRMWGNGGFGSPGELVISYTDRYYGPTVGEAGMETLARHEITHAAGIGVDGPGDGVEFNVEGLAVFIAGGHYKPEPLGQRGAAMYELGYQAPVGGFVGQHELDYLHGAALLTYISDTYGLESVWELLAADVGPADGQMTSLADAVEQALDITLDQLDQDFQQWLAAGTPGEQLDDLRLTIELQDLRRSYQQTYAPPPLFIAGPAASAITRPEYLPVVLREANAPFNMTVELIIAEGQRAILDGDYAGARRIVDILADILESGTFADPLAKDYIDIVTVLANASYEVAALTINGNSSTAKVFLQAPELLDVELVRTGGQWRVK